MTPEPKSSLFIRTYHADAPWLVELLRSIDKFCSGWHEIVVHCDTADLPIITPIVGQRAKLVHCRPWGPNGYTSQQAAKALADTFCSGGYITFCDSDCIFIKEATPSSFFVDGKPQILFTPYAVMGDRIPWRKPTEFIMQRVVPHEFMRGVRLTFLQPMFARFRAFVMKQHRVADFGHWFAHLPSVSEFNAFGAYCWFYEHDSVSWLDTTREPLPFNPIRQFWSKSGITPEVRALIESFLA